MTKFSHSSSLPHTLLTIQQASKNAPLWRAYQDKKALNRMLFPTEGASQLGVSEFELMLSAPHSRYLGQECRAVLQALVALSSGEGDNSNSQIGKVESIVRNDYAVSEKLGEYANLNLGEKMGLMINVGGLDLRYFIDKWQHMLAWDDTTNPKRATHAIAFFDGAGNAINKVYLKDHSEAAMQAWQGMIEQTLQDWQAGKKGQSEDEAMGSGEVIKLAVNDPPSTWQLKTLTDTDKQTLHDKWLGMTDTHQMFGILKALDIDRASSYAQAPEGMTTQLDPKAFETLLHRVQANTCPVIIFVGNTGVIQIQTGTIKNIKRLEVAGESWLNVLDKDHNDFTLHLKDGAIAQLWCVKRPTKDGIVTSIEAFDAQGRTIITVFGERSEGKPELAAWQAITDAMMADCAG